MHEARNTFAIFSPTSVPTGSVRLGTLEKETVAASVDRSFFSLATLSFASLRPKPREFSPIPYQSDECFLQGRQPLSGLLPGARGKIACHSARSARLAVDRRPPPAQVGGPDRERRCIRVGTTASAGPKRAPPGTPSSSPRRGLGWRRASPRRGRFQCPVFGPELLDRGAHEGSCPRHRGLGGFQGSIERGRPIEGRPS